MIIPDGFAQATWRFTGANVPLGAVCTMGFRLDDEITPADMSDELYSAWEDNLRGHQVSTCVLSSCLVKFGPNDTGPSGETVGSAAGTASGPGAEPQISALCRKITTVGGHAGRGRFYMPGLPDAAVADGGLIDGATLTGLQADVALFLGAISTLVYVPVVLHGPDSPISLPSTVVQLLFDSRCATQRRRNRR